MKEKFRIVFRDSLLSRAQVEIVRAKALEFDPEIEFELMPVQTTGDREHGNPVSASEGKDLFTKDLQQILKNKNADIAIHSLKDVSSSAFFNETQYAVVDRNDMRDIAIFCSDIITKLQQQQQITIGTSSPRRSGMAIPFLRKAFPSFDKNDIEIKASPIRGNVDQRLSKLQNNEYDGIILAMAGLNRLLNYGPAAERTRALLEGKKWMVLPLFECPPAPGQGVIVIEALRDNGDIALLLNALNDQQLGYSLGEEQVFASKYGSGCTAEYGLFHMHLPNTSFTFAAGRNGAGEDFTDWKMDINIHIGEEKLFSSTDHMKSFFRSEPDPAVIVPEDSPAFFVSSHKAIHSDTIKEKLNRKRVWAAGTHTWYQLAKKGIWVEGCADGLGLESVRTLLAGPLVGLRKSDIRIITNKSSTAHWNEDGWNSTGTYELIPSLPVELREKIMEAEMIFWSSFQQYELCKDFLKKNLIHACPAGKTATLLKARGLDPLIFPTIRAFNFWRNSNQSPNG